MVIKGRIHGELGKFERYLGNSVKSDNEMRLKIGQFNMLRKITQNQIHGIKKSGGLDENSKRIQNLKIEENSFQNYDRKPKF